MLVLVLKFIYLKSLWVKQEMQLINTEQDPEWWNGILARYDVYCLSIKFNAFVYFKTHKADQW